MSSQSQIDNRKSQIPGLVVFDLGRVLIRICNGWQQAFERVGVTIAAGAIDRETRLRLLEGVSRIETGELAVSAFCDEVAGHLGLPCEVVKKMWRGYTLGPYAGADALLDDLAAAGVATACLSNTSAEHWTVLTDPADPQGRVVNRLTHRFASHLVRARKPDAAIYAHLEQATGVAPASIVFFDDVEDNVAAAVKRGWRCHVIRHDGDPIAQIRTHLAADGLI